MSPPLPRSSAFQSLRGAAAFAVLLYHASHYLGELRGDARFLSVFSGIFGAYGVALFFALSGFLMARVLEREDQGRFLLRRMARIYPLMLLTVAIFALLFLSIGKPRGVNLLALTLVPSGPRGYFLTVEWTLVLEITYYAVLAALGLLGAGLARTPLIIAWTVAILLAFAMGPGRTEQLLPTISQIPLSIVNLPFALGYLAAEWQRRRELPRFPVWLAIAPAVAAGFSSDLPITRLLAGISAALVVAWLALRQSGNAPSWLGRLGERLGDASYALYLCHVPVILLTALLLPAGLPGAFVWAFWLAAAISVALVLTPLDLFVQARLRASIESMDRRKARLLAVIALLGFAIIAASAELQRMRADAERDQALRTLSLPSRAAGGAVQVRIDQVARAPNGQWTVRGHAIDLDRPDVGAIAAVRQSGRILALGERPRLRPDIATALGRPDIAERRFGFLLALPETFDCKGGAAELVVAFADGRAIAPPQEPMAAVCER